MGFEIWDLTEEEKDENKNLPPFQQTKNEILLLPLFTFKETKGINGK